MTTPVFRFRDVVGVAGIGLIAVLALVPLERALAMDATSATLPALQSDSEIRFQNFLRDFRAEALAAGITAEVYDRATAGLTPNIRVLELNDSQPEFVRPIWEYLDGAVSEQRIALGREALAANAEVFDRIESEHGVPREVVTAIWGLETNFGQTKGRYNLFQALATLAYEGRRQQFGRSQLLAALRISQDEDIDPEEMTGSWAGAFGHTQFIPTTFLEHAVDGDGDGKRDLWNSSADALTSAASYLRRSGWRAGRSWGEEVRLPEGFAYETAGREFEMPQSAWVDAGLRSVTGAAITPNETESSVLLPAGATGPAFLVNGNFTAIMRYNAATSYSLAIGVLSNRLMGQSGIVGTWPQDQEPLSRSQRIALQEGLTALGFSTGGADGIIGPMTSAAIRDFQRARGMTADGFADASLITRILNENSLRR